MFFLVSCDIVFCGKVLVMFGKNILRICTVNKLYSRSSVRFRVESHFGLLEDAPRT